MMDLFNGENKKELMTMSVNFDDINIRDLDKPYKMSQYFRVLPYFRYNVKYNNNDDMKYDDNDDDNGMNDDILVCNNLAIFSFENQLIGRHFTDDFNVNDFKNMINMIHKDSKNINDNNKYEWIWKIIANNHKDNNSYNQPNTNLRWINDSWTKFQVLWNKMNKQKRENKKNKRSESVEDIENTEIMENIASTKDLKDLKQKIDTNKEEEYKERAEKIKPLINKSQNQPQSDKTTINETEIDGLHINESQMNGSEINGSTKKSNKKQKKKKRKNKKLNKQSDDYASSEVDDSDTFCGCGIF